MDNTIHTFFIDIKRSRPDMVYGKAVLALCALHLSLSGIAAFTIPGKAPLSRVKAKSPVVVHSAESAESSTSNGPLAEDIWTNSPSVKVQGNTLKTWDIGEETTQRVQLSIRSEGRPLDTNVELWHTPSYIPTKFRCYTEDGNLRPIHAVIETPKHPKTVAVFNTGSMEFPFDATVANTGLDSAYSSLSQAIPEKVQGGKITSYAFGPEVESVQILLKTVERNMKVKIELTQGPNQVKQIFELYASSGYKNPFYAVIQTPGSANSIRVINQNTVEFPIDAWVLPYETSDGSELEPIMGGWM